MPRGDKIFGDFFATGNGQRSGLLRQRHAAVRERDVAATIASAADGERRG